MASAREVANGNAVQDEKHSPRISRIRRFRIIPCPEVVVCVAFVAPHPNRATFENRQFAQS
jgi:hypothetical protein